MRVININILFAKGLAKHTLILPCYVYYERWKTIIYNPNISIIVLLKVGHDNSGLFCVAASAISRTNDDPSIGSRNILLSGVETLISIVKLLMEIVK